MKKFIRKFDYWWKSHTDAIATWVTVIAIVELAIICLATAGLVSEIPLICEIEELLTAHGVEWALYTMP